MATANIQTDDRRRLIHVTWEGVCSPQEHVEVIRRIISLIRPGYGALIDMTRAMANIPFATNSLIATERAAHNYPTAFVVSDPVSAGSASQFSSLVDSRGGSIIAVFRDMQEAVAWLE